MSDHDHVTTGKDQGIGWMDLSEHLADALLPYRPSERHVELLDLLGEALEECVISFPIMHSGEELNNIDPFTFFAAFNHALDSQQHKRLVVALCVALGVEESFCSDFAIAATAADTAADSFAAGSGFPVGERELRFFTFEERRSALEIDLLWELFITALGFADGPSEQTRRGFILSYNTAVGQRVRGAGLLTIALHWIRPRFYLPLTEEVKSCVQDRLVFEADIFAQPPEAEAYLGFLDKCDRALSSGVFGEQTQSRVSLIRQVRESAQTKLPGIDKEKTKQLLKAIMPKYSEIHARNTQLWRAVQCFQKNWDSEADDFRGMLTAALAEQGGLLSVSYLFDPYREIMHFARREDETVRTAFGQLFNEEVPLGARLIRFEEITAALFERYRGDMVRAFAKRSAHGNFTAIATYLFLRYPNTSYLYNPLRIKAIISQVGYNATIRVVQSESVAEYYSLCDQLLEIALEKEDLLTASQTAIDPTCEYEDPAHHLLIEDIVSAANRHLIHLL